MALIQGKPIEEVLTREPQAPSHGLEEENHMDEVVRTKYLRIALALVV